MGGRGKKNFEKGINFSFKIQLFLIQINNIKKLHNWKAKLVALSL